MIIAQAAALGIGFLLDMIFGDPNFFLHPVRLIGGLVSITEKALRRIFPKNKTGETVGGALMVIIVTAVSGAVPFVILLLLYRRNIIAGAAAESVICYFMIAARALGREGNKIYYSLLRRDIDKAREQVSMIVGRDTDSLDDVGITKAAVETIAENICDGIVAPLIYMALGGAVLGCMYKAVNTMDSMVGYKNERYLYFGKAAAKLDDIANYIPSRIAARVMIFASRLLGFDAGNASYIHRRDSRKHASPNSAQTESVMAGALRIRLAGDAYYFGELYKKPFIGDSIKDVKYDNIKQASRIMYLTSVICAAVLVAAKIAVGCVI